MSKKAKKIVSIDIELEDFEPIHLKMDEAKELYEQLHDLFGDKQKDVQYHYYPWYHRPYYSFADQSGVGVLCNNSGIADAVSNVALNTIQSTETGMQVSYNTE